MGSSTTAAAVVVVVLPPPSPSSSWKSSNNRRIPTLSSLPIASPSPSPSSSSSSLPLRSRSLRPLSAATVSDGIKEVEEEKEESEEEEEEAGPSASSVGFVEVGYLGKAHGVRGEIQVFPTTGFPELRFCTPGTRWLRYLELGKEKIRQVELVGGRKGHKGYWLVRFDGIDTVEKAKQIVGSAILVREDDRPVLEEGEFYTRDLIGMKVILKENGTPVGTVIKVVNYGANDLLQVKLDPSEGLLKMDGAHDSLVWIPFVEAIVPDVDMEKRVMQLTPPKGLLELNLRSDPRTKKERSKMEWKERRKLQKRVSSARKKLSAMGQKHVLEAFSFGETDEKTMLANQILDIDYSLLEHMLNKRNTIKRFNLSECLESELMLSKSMNVPQKYLTFFPSDDKENEESKHFKFLTSGIDLVCENKVCMILVAGDGNNQVVRSQNDGASSGEPTQLCQIEELLNNERFLKMHGRRIPAPLIIVSPVNDVEYYQQLFLGNDYFGFDIDKVRFLKEPRLPVLSDETGGRILLKSPCEILQSPVGSGGIFSLLSANHILDEIRDWGVNYVQVTGLTNVSVVGQLSLLGLVKSKGSDIGFRISGSGSPGMEHDFDVVLSVKCLNKVARDPGKIKLHAVVAEYEHVELVDGEWKNICPTESNCVCIRSSIYSLLDTCSDRICILRTSQD